MILVPGISIPELASPDKGRGFTILEILVVVGIISVMASVIVLNIQFKRPDAELGKHIDYLQKSIKLLSQEAILENRNFALSVQPKQYLVLEFNGENWVPVEDKLFRNLQAEHRFQVDLIVDKQPVKIEKTEQPQPHVLILSSGEMSVFEWQVDDRNNDYQVQLFSTLTGDLTIEGPIETRL